MHAATPITLKFEQCTRYIFSIIHSHNDLIHSTSGSRQGSIQASGKWLPRLMLINRLAIRLSQAPKMPVSKLTEIRIHAHRRTHRYRHTDTQTHRRSRSAGNPCKYANDLEPRKQLTLFTGCLRLLSLFIGFFHKLTHTRKHAHTDTHARRQSRAHTPQTGRLFSMCMMREWSR